MALSIWAGLGFTFIIMTAALQSIPRELYESAFVDGAGGWRRFTNVTLPMLSPTLLFVVVVTTSRAFQAYGEIDLLTGGGPNSAGRPTETVTYLIYGKTSIIAYNIGLQVGHRRAAVRRAADPLVRPVPGPRAAGALCR